MGYTKRPEYQEKSYRKLTQGFQNTKNIPKEIRTTEYLQSNHIKFKPAESTLKSATKSDDSTPRVEAKNSFVQVNCNQEVFPKDTSITEEPTPLDDNSMDIIYKEDLSDNSIGEESPDNNNFETGKKAESELSKELDPDYIFQDGRI